jgi:thymidylate kinase
MTPVRLVFIDGIPGSGKSTTAQRLCLHLASLGARARWWYEHEQGHPVLDDAQVRSIRTGAGDAAGLFARALDGWSALAAACGAGGTVILESTLFQTTVGTQLLLDWPRGEIDAHFDRTLERIEPLAPALIHLRAAEPDDALRRICAERQPWFEQFLLEQLRATPRGRRLGRITFSEVLEYFRDVREVSDGMFARFQGLKLSRDPLGNAWPQTYRSITDLLGLPPMTPLAPPSRPGDYTGRFRAEGTGDEWEFEDRGGELFFAGYSRGRLLPCGGDRFAVEGVCVDVMFEREGGAVGSLRCSGALPGLARRWLRV